MICSALGTFSGMWMAISLQIHQYIGGKPRPPFAVFNEVADGKFATDPIQPLFVSGTEFWPVGVAIAKCF